MEAIETRAVVKYLQIKGLSPKAIHEDMQATVGNDAPGYSTVTKWCTEFKYGRSSVTDDRLQLVRSWHLTLYFGIQQV